MKGLKQMWQDDSGAILATEYLFVATILVIGLVIGLAGLRTAINAELTELGNAILALSQGFTVNGADSSGGSVDGSGTMDTPGTLTPPTPALPAIPSVVDVPVP